MRTRHGQTRHYPTLSWDPKSVNAQDKDDSEVQNCSFKKKIPSVTDNLV